MSEYDLITQQVENLLNGIFKGAVKQGLTSCKKKFFGGYSPHICDLNLPSNSVILGARLAGSGNEETMDGFELSYVKSLTSEGPNTYYFAQLTADESGFDFSERALLVDVPQRIGKELPRETLPYQLNSFEDALPILKRDLIPYLESLQNLMYDNQPTTDFALIRDVLASETILE